MKILLQHTRTQLYLRNAASWTANEFEALDFQHSQKAVDYAEENEIADVQIAVKFIDSHYDVTAPLSAIHVSPPASARPGLQK
jgi:hypothetical protein